ncbi:threonine dehydratase [Telmatospirillum sp.]|uniref:threonine dehydratase n=1 Tax=Telmatospirillum sp. TaxID=2079197 RepID=UPI00283D2FDF|nr:threonine dehydratase [Telmatospirillum sp.]MDR3437947.1 threonine dehydratase [Telmatospirillum sp.]
MTAERRVMLAELEAAAHRVYQVMAPTPQYAWPLLAERTGAEVWVKHENHGPVGAFKLRGGIVYMERLRESVPDVAGVIAATRGNHGQSVAFAAARAGLPAVIVVPEGNNPEKNAAMRALGAELIEQGEDFQEARELALRLAGERGLHMVPSFHPWLVWGVASAALEFLRAVPSLDTVYVPIGLGSGICAMIAARDALGLSTRIVGVVAEGAPAYADSFWAGRPMSTPTVHTLADGLACRVPDPTAVDVIIGGADRVVTVSDDAILAAMRYYLSDTHNLAEGAGAAPLAALLAERTEMAGRKVGLVLSGGNADADLIRQALKPGGL